MAPLRQPAKDKSLEPVYGWVDSPHRLAPGPPPLRANINRNIQAYDDVIGHSRYDHDAYDNGRKNR